jgi:hypothetical protein
MINFIDRAISQAEQMAEILEEAVAAGVAIPVAVYTPSSGWLTGLAVHARPSAILTAGRPVDRAGVAGLGARVHRVGASGAVGDATCERIRGRGLR